VAPATLIVSSAMSGRLEALANRHAGKSMTDVLQRAVALYNFLIEKSATHDIILRHQCSGEEQLLDLGVNALIPPQESQQEATGLGTTQST
jgi:hypothetical protein